MIDPKDLIKHFPSINQCDYLCDGGFKHVYKILIGTEHEILKTVNLRSGSKRTESIQRITREINLLKILKTNKIVKLGSIDPIVIQHQSQEFLVYSEEFLDGQTLREIIDGPGSPSKFEIVSLADSLLEAICELDNIDHLHRDIKPENIIFTAENDRQFVLLDFGIAFKVGGTNFTAHGCPPHTIGYTAPEVIDPRFNGNIDIRSDIYSIGVNVFEYASGYHPIRQACDTYQSTLIRVMSTSPTKIDHYRSDLPNEICDLIDSCIKKKPALRPNSPTRIKKIFENHK